jgi:hypothetical protein
MKHSGHRTKTHARSPSICARIEAQKVRRRYAPAEVAAHLQEHCIASSMGIDAEQPQGPEHLHCMLSCVGGSLRAQRGPAGPLPEVRELGHAAAAAPIEPARSGCLDGQQSRLGAVGQQVRKHCTAEGHAGAQPRHEWNCGVVRVELWISLRQQHSKTSERELA